MRCSFLRVCIDPLCKFHNPQPQAFPPPDEMFSESKNAGAGMSKAISEQEEDLIFSLTQANKMIDSHIARITPSVGDEAIILRNLSKNINFAIQKLKDIYGII